MTSFYTWPLKVAATTYIKILWTRIPNTVVWSNLVMQNIVNLVMHTVGKEVEINQKKHHNWREKKWRFENVRF